MRRLLIIESPGKATKLRAILGEGWEVMASVGHVRDLPEDGLQVGPSPAFAAHYEITSNRRDVVARLRQAARGAEVHLGTDPDREGESIAWHLQQCLDLRSYKRVRFSEITAKAVHAAIANGGTIDLPLVRAQEARRIWDRLVGYLVSPELRRRAGRSMSAGRVQSPAVRLVVEREREIASFASRVLWAVRLWSEGPAGEWWLDLMEADGSQRARLEDRSVADRLSVLDEVAVRGCVEAQEEEPPPPPFTTSSLQQAASTRLGLKPARTMELAQKLYEAGHITYHRTDNPNLGDDALEAIRGLKDARRIGVVGEQRRFRAPKGAQAAHPAISPTHWETASIAAEDDLTALYELVRWRAVASQLAPATFSTRRLEAGSIDPVTRESLTFVATRRERVSPGWRALPPFNVTHDDEVDDEAEGINLVPPLVAGTRIAVSRGQVLDVRTRAPKRFTEATLIRKLEECGVGRPSTYASILEAIQHPKRTYVRTEKRFLQPTHLGEELCQLVSGRFGFADVGYTREVELIFDAIANGETSYEAAIGELFGRLAQELRLFIAAGPKCAACRSSLVHLQGTTRGSKNDYNIWRCDEEACGSAWVDLNGAPDFGRPIARRVAREASEDDTPCPMCCKALNHVKGTARGSGKPYDFWSCSDRTCGATYPNGEGRPILSAGPRRPDPDNHACPRCGCSLALRSGTSQRTGKPYELWFCTDRSCGALFGNQDGSPIFDRHAAGATASKEKRR